MRVYADTSFLVKLVTEETRTEEAMGEFRRLDFPPLFYLPIHALEVTNAVRQRAFHRNRSTEKLARASIGAERDKALSRVEKWITRGWFTEATVEWPDTFVQAQKLSEKHTERLGCRGFDLLHVACALELGCEIFLTADKVQGGLARTAGLEVTVI